MEDLLTSVSIFSFGYYLHLLAYEVKEGPDRALIKFRDAAYKIFFIMFIRWLSFATIERLILKYEINILTIRPMDISIGLLSCLSIIYVIWELFNS